MNNPKFSTFSVVLAAVAALSLAGCNRYEAGACAQTAKAAQDEASPSSVVATWGSGEKLTAAELDKEVGPELRKMEKEHRKKMAEARRERLDQLIIERLLKTEATKRGLSEEGLIKAEIEDKVVAPSEADIKKVFDGGADELPPGSTIDQFRERIVEFLTQKQKQELVGKLVEKLRKDGNVQVLLPVERIAVEAKGPSRGPEDAKVTIVEFSDFECPFCSKAHDTVEKVMAAYPGKLRLVFRQFPLPFHPHAAKAAAAALCAHEQGKFWELHDALFTNQKALEADQVKGYAKALGLDEAKFAQCLDGGQTSKTVEADAAAGKEAGVEGTPAFFINGIFLSGAQPEEEFKRIIDQELAR